jgi:hypothetical protein
MGRSKNWKGKTQNEGWKDETGRKGRVKGGRKEGTEGRKEQKDGKTRKKRREGRKAGREEKKTMKSET